MPIREDVKVGARTKIWHPELVNLYGCSLGEDCNMGCFVEIGPNASVGDRCRIESKVYIPEGVHVGNDVFLGPGVIFLNDKHPPSERGVWTAMQTFVEDGVSIGGGALIMPGLRLGSRCVIGAGAVVTRDVPADAVIVGVPGRVMHQQEGKLIKQETKSMYDFCIMTPTYQRSELLTKVVESLKKEADESGFKMLHCIVDDGSNWMTHPYEKLVAAWTCDRYKILYRRQPKNFGRKGFWRTWCLLMELARSEEWDFGIAIPDDHLMCQNFLKKSRERFLCDQLAEPTVCAVNLMPKWVSNWGRTRYVDGAFICNRKFFELLSWKMLPIGSAWFDSQSSKKLSKIGKGSGVGKQMSDRIEYSQKGKIAVVNGMSYLKGMDVPSVMFPQNMFPLRPQKFGSEVFEDDKSRVQGVSK